MDKGLRLLGLLQQVEKITAQRRDTRSPDDIQQLRYLTARILQLTISQGAQTDKKTKMEGAQTDKKTKLEEKVYKDIIIKNPAQLDLLLTTLESCGDSCTKQNIVFILTELIGKTNSGKRVCTLVCQGATHALLQTLVTESREAAGNEPLLLAVHQLLVKLAPKDRKFAVKARLCQALCVTLNLVRACTANPKALLPLLQILKIYSANAVNASYLGRQGAVSHLFRVLSACGRKHLTLVKYALDALALLVKSKSNSARAVGQGGVPVLLTMFFDWHKVDSKNRHISLRKANLSVLKHVTNLKSGRRALMDADGIRLLYTTCQDSLDCRELETLVIMASFIMRKCFPRNRLPLSGLRSPLHFPLPRSDFHVPDPGEGQGEVGLMSVIGQLQSGDDNGYESSIDNDDDISSDDDLEPKGGSEEDGDQDFTGLAADRRSSEDLQMYRHFFPEQHELDMILEDEAGFHQNMMMTGSSHTSCPPLHFPNPRQSHSSPETRTLGLPTRGLVSHRSVPALSGEEELIKALQEMNFSPFHGDLDLITEHLFAPDNNRGLTGRHRLTGLDSDYRSDSPDNDGRNSVTAINVKTGTNVINLDVNSKNAKSASGRSPSQKVKKKSTKNSKSSKKKEKTKASKSTELEWLKTALQPTLSITQMTPRDRCFFDNYAADFVDDTDQVPVYQLENPDLFAEIASRTKSVGRFNKIPFSEMYGHMPPPYKEPLYEKRFGTQREKVFGDIDRFINPDHVIDRVVYDLDSIINTAGATYNSSYSSPTNNDDVRVLRGDETGDHLKFNAQFECGNLRKAIQVRHCEYDLLLSPDVNTNHHHQWFYFEVSNMTAGVKYTFNIVNCEKLNSQFNFGMRPLLFSVKEALEGQPCWVRSGTEICYYKNHFVRSAQVTGGVRGKTYYTSTFSIRFNHDKDVCYLAYHYPYSYSMLQYHIHNWENTYNSEQIYYRNHVLCDSLGGNPVPVLTITSHPNSYDREGVLQMKNRPYIFLSSRVHPGESNSSWVMKGTISFLLSDRPMARTLRDMYIFKIVPMLNPDGVINGNHRCSLVAEDLNRRWLQPCPKLHPTIYHCKGLLQYLQNINKVPLIYCDYHGHSRRKNVFLYGCSASMSWMAEDIHNPNVIGNKMEDTCYKALPRLLQGLAPSFCLNNCSFMVEKSKESTGRVVVWRQLGVIRSYTMESSYCGCDQGPYKGHHISTRELEEMGRKFCEALLKVRSRHQRVLQQPSMPLISAGGMNTRLQDPEIDILCKPSRFGDEGGAAGCDYQSSLGEARMGIDSSSDHSGPSMAASLPQEDEEDEEEEEEEDDEDLLAGPEDDDGDFT